MVAAVAGALGSVLPAVFGVAGLGASLLKKRGAAKPVQPLPGATRDDAAAQQNLNDELLRRKGGAADILTGVRGAEAPSGGLKASLGA